MIGQSVNFGKVWRYMKSKVFLSANFFVPIVACLVHFIIGSFYDFIFFDGSPDFPQAFWSIASLIVAFSCGIIGWIS